MSVSSSASAAVSKPSDLAKVAIVGGGAFGTAVANIVARNGHKTMLWMRDADQVEQACKTRENTKYLPGHRLEDAIFPTADLAEAVTDAPLVFMTVPSSSFRSVCETIKPLVRSDVMLVSATKGIEADGFRLMSQILSQVLKTDRVGALSGPNLAVEIAQGQYTGTVIASHDAQLRRVVQEGLASETLRVYGNDDVYGVELAGALKNIYAIICGLAAAMGVGQNTSAMLITRALAEMSRFAVSMGANPFTFLGLAGVGDLMVTCSSELSRNYRLGARLGRGMSLDEAVADLGKLAEGVNTLSVVCAEAQRRDVYMPLANGLHKVVFEGAELGSTIATLMSNAQGDDVEFALPGDVA